MGFLRRLILLAVLFAGVLSITPARAYTIYTNCSWSQATDFTYAFPTLAVAINQSLPAGMLLGDWLPFSMNTGSGWLCVNGVNGGGAGASFNLYWGGIKPAATFAAPGIAPVVENGLSHTVWTTTPLQTSGLGYIVEWRVVGMSGFGQWVTPPSNWGNEWMPPATAGIDFWRSNVNRFVGNNCTQNVPFGSLTSLQAWWTVVNSNTEKRYCFGTGIETRLRYVLIKPGSELVSELDDLSHSRTIQSEIMKNRPDSLNREFVRIIANSTVNLTIKPWGTCTTPSVTVPFGMVFETDLPNQGSVTPFRNFDLTFTKCPRVNINWYVHANDRWVNSVQGVVGLSGSTPNVDPVAGNPRGIGIQLAHNGGVHGTGLVYINQNMGNVQQTYTRTPANGTNITTGPNQGITHTIALRARVIRTHPTGTPINPGAFTAAVIVAVQYP